MNITEQQVELLAPDASSLKAGKGLSNAQAWLTKSFNERVLWGEIKGSGSKPYRTQVDLQNIAFKCSCPSFKFPCKHGIGLMLAFAKQNTLFEQTEAEPDWVKEWIDKRQAKVEKKAEVIVTEAVSTDEKIQKSKEKRQKERFTQVEAGVAELELWLKDLLRTGFLVLPSKEMRFFEQMAARLVDAKTTGLAARVKAFRDLNYTQKQWQADAIRITSELFLLIEAFKNLQNLSPEWQQTIKNLIGWNQSPKELLQNPEAEKVNDYWIVLGQEQQENEGIIVQRNWLWGVKSNRSALILNFGTAYSPLENMVLPGSIIEADLVFFPSVLPHRAVISLPKGFINQLQQELSFLANWSEALIERARQLSINPFAVDIPLVISGLRFMIYDEQYFLCDTDMNYVQTSLSWPDNKMLMLYVSTGEQPSNVAGVFRQDGFLPLGLFEDNQYIML